MSRSATAKWILLALVGLAIAIGIAIAAANLTSRQIGIASESVSAGDALAPALHVQPEGRPQGEGGDQPGPGNEETTPAPPPATTTTEELPPPEETTGPDDHGGEGGQSGGSDSDGDDD